MRAGVYPTAMTKILDQKFGNVRVRIEVLCGAGGPPRYELPAQVWRRAAWFMSRFGAPRALDLIDARAERALERGNVPAACRWRNLIAAIHAVEEDERTPGEPMH